MSKIITTTHQKGGVGKSTLAANIALNLAKSATVAIVDLDHHGSLVSLQSQFENINIYPASTPVVEIRQLSYDFIIIDTPPYLFDNLENLAQISGLIIIPTKASLLDVIAINKTLGLVLGLIDKDKLLIVMNMIKANTTLTNDVYRELKKYGVEIAKTRISDLVDYTRSIMNKGCTTTKAQMQLDALIKETLTKLL